MSPVLIVSDVLAARQRRLDDEAARIVARLVLILGYARAMDWCVAHLALRGAGGRGVPINGLEPSPSEPIFSLASGEAPEPEAMLEVLGGRPLALVLAGFGFAELIAPVARACRGVGWPVVLLDDAIAWGPERELRVRALARDGVRFSSALALTAPPDERLVRLMMLGKRRGDAEEMN